MFILFNVSLLFYVSYSIQLYLNNLYLGKVVALSDFLVWVLGKNGGTSPVLGERV